MVFKEPLSAAQGQFQSSGYAGNHAGHLGQAQPQFARSGMRPSLTPIAPRPPSQNDYLGHGSSGMSEDVFFARQPGMAPPDPQYFDFNAYSAMGTLEPQQMLPNPLLASGYSQNAAGMAVGTRGIPASWQDQVGMSYNTGLRPSGMPGNQLAAYIDVEEEDDDAMSISDDEMADPNDSGSLQKLTAAWNGNRVDARKFGLFAHSGALFSYMDSPANSELRNQGEMTIFSYFLNITSPTISMYERHPCDPIEKQEFHTKGHNLWSCKCL